MYGIYVLGKRSNNINVNRLNEEDKYNIICYLDYYPKQSSGDNDEIRYLEYTKKFIYNQYIKNDDNRKITYNIFIKYIPKKYKIGKRKTDMCGICVLGKRLVNVNRLSEEGKTELKRNSEIYQSHLKIVENQKYMFNRIKNNLKEYDCILILDFKENFRLNYEKIETGFDHFNKRQVSCLGAAIIFNNGIEIKTEYVVIFQIF